MVIENYNCNYDNNMGVIFVTSNLAALLAKLLVTLTSTIPMS